ncbi:MAG: YceI family protein [Bacteroidota bacterium]
MKQIPFLAVILFSAIFNTACKNSPESDEAVTTAPKEVADESGQTFVIQNSESAIEWIGTKVSGYHEGKVPIKSGRLTVKAGGIASGNFVLDLANITVTGPKASKTEANGKLEGHLKSGDFFDVEKFPEGSFEITSVKPYTEAVTEADDPRQEAISKYKVANPTHKVSGNLTLKGITKNIEFSAKITLSGNSAEAIAKFNIDRTQWDIVYPGKPDDLIRNEVHLGIMIKATRENGN